MPMSKVYLDFEPLRGRNGHEAGRELLAKMYRAIAGGEMPEIRRTPRGKPYFAEGTFYFSISHTGGHVFCALADHAIGLDAEEMDRQINLKLAEKILSSGEKERFLSAEDKRIALLKLWVLKEAAAKLSGEGLRGYPNHTDFSPDDPRIQELGGCYVAVLEE